MLQAGLISIKEKEKDFDILITELNEKIRQLKLKIENSIGYLVGVYQKKRNLKLKRLISKKINRHFSVAE